jgi:hypothetical protein
MNSMPNGKTHFIAGAAVGATVNFIIQSAKMAMDYDRPFDWGEFFLCTGAGAYVANPEGIASFSPGLASLRAYPGFATPEFRNPERVAPPGRSSATRAKDWLEAKFPHSSEFDHRPNLLRSIYTLLSSALIAWAISSKHTPKLSRTTRLFLWSFGIGYLSHIARNSGTHIRWPKLATFNFQHSTSGIHVNVTGNLR